MVGRVLSGILVAIVLGTAWGNDYQSCVRSEHVRASLRISFQAQAARAKARAADEHGATRALDLRAEAANVAAVGRVSHLVCLRPLPPT